MKKKRRSKILCQGPFKTYVTYPLQTSSEMAMPYRYRTIPGTRYALVNKMTMMTPRIFDFLAPVQYNQLLTSRVGAVEVGIEPLVAELLDLLHIVGQEMIRKLFQGALYR